MALIKCPECGKEISDRAAICPNCGFPIKEYLSTNAKSTAPDSENKNNDSQKTLSDEHENMNSGSKNIVYPSKEELKQMACFLLSALRWIIATVIFLFGLFSFIGIGISMLVPFLLFSASAYMVSPLSSKFSYKLSKNTRIFLAFVSLILAFFIGVLGVSTTSNSRQTSANETDIIETDTIETESQSTEAPSVQESEVPPSEISQESESTTESYDFPQDSETVFFLDFVENWKQYTNEYITTSFQVGSYNEEEKKLESVYRNGADVTAYVNNYRFVGDGNYVTVTGMVSTESSTYPVLTDAYLIESGMSVKDAYLQDEVDYNERKKIEAEEYEALFKETAEAVSYENLARYPDTYESKKIKLTVTISDVQKKDSLLFQDSYKATFSGKTIAIYDGREVKEPKLLDGDKVTIYGYGKGLTELKTYDKSGIIPKTISKEKIPAVSIEFIEF